MQASRLLSILMLLQARGRATAPELAQALEVSVRTILRDVDQLSLAGVPIWASRGRQGGFRLREGWSTELTGLTEPEVSALFLAGLHGPATELGLGAAAMSARLKMIAALPAPWREQADRVASRLHVDPVDWYRTQETPRLLREVADAVWQGYRIGVRYVSWRGISAHELEPLGLVLKAGAWYLVAQRVGRQGALTFRLANIQEITPRRARIKRPLRFDLVQYWRESAARFEAELYRLQAHVRVSPRGMTWLANQRVKATPVSEATRRRGARADWQEVLIPIESIEHGARQLLAFGQQLEVLAPAELRTQVCAELDALRTLYAG
jgi:predicted DNA-binding transcriptional regulator YafY